MASLYSSTGLRQHAKDAAALVTKALSLVAESDAAGLAAVKPQAVAAVTTFIQLPDAFTCDFAELPAVQALAKDAQHAGLSKLLAALLAGDMQARCSGYDVAVARSCAHACLRRCLKQELP